MRSDREKLRPFLPPNRSISSFLVMCGCMGNESVT
jgi:hypothetical protein